MADWTIVRFHYRNHKGREAIRTVRPIRIWYGSTGFHQDAQWLLECFDIDKQETRDYAMSGILSSWERAV
jgi:predicted DNA-binding transcriptional regulator YafY